MAADVIVALTAEEVTYHTDLSGISPSKIRVVPVAIDLTHFTPDGPSWPRGPRPRIVAAGRLVERKGHHDLLQAFASIPGAELFIAGGPPLDRLDHEPLVRSLRKRASELNVLDRVTFLGRIPHSEMPSLLRSADVFVTAPHYEPFGTVALEAAACGVPVIATAVGGLRTHVLDDETGLLVPRGDTAALATALRDLLADPSRRAALGTAGAQRAQRYSWPRVADELLAVYRSVIA